VKSIVRSDRFRWTLSALFSAILPLAFCLIFLNLDRPGKLSEAPFITLEDVTLPQGSAEKLRAVRPPSPKKPIERPPEPREAQPQPLPDEPVYAPAATEPAPPNDAVSVSTAQPVSPIEETGFVDAKQLDNTDFTPVYNPKPLYPAIAREAHIEGYVVVELTIDPKGYVKSFSITKTAGHQQFALETSRVIRKWRFPPPRIKGQPVEIRYEYKVVFKLE